MTKTDKNVDADAREYAKDYDLYGGPATPDIIELLRYNAYLRGHAAGRAEGWDKSYCPCGGIILADTEDWPVPLCNRCYEIAEKHFVSGGE